MKGESCLTNYMELFEDVTGTIDNAETGNMMYLDFQKIFGEVPQKNLTFKIKAHGLRIGAQTGNRKQDSSYSK